jgi:tryptophan-rich sensory protein
VWDAFAWQFVSLTWWLFFLLFADTKEREKIGEHAHKPIAIAFNMRSNLWLLSLILASFGAWNVWRQNCWDGASALLIVYFIALTLTLWHWRLFWVSHRFLLSFITAGLASVMAGVAVFSAAAFSVLSGFLLLPYACVQLFEAVYAWLFYKSNASKEIGSRDLGRFQERTERANANVFVLSQNPHLHIIPSNFQLPDQPRTLRDATKSQHLDWS